MKQEVEKWRPFGHPDGDIRDLSFLDAHQAVYVQHHAVSYTHLTLPTKRIV